MTKKELVNNCKKWDGSFTSKWKIALPHISGIRGRALWLFKQRKKEGANENNKDNSWHYLGKMNSITLTLKSRSLEKEYHS